MTGPSTGADPALPELRVLFGTERFASRHGWGELAALMPGALQVTVNVQWSSPGVFVERPRSELIDVVVPVWAELDAKTIHGHCGDPPGEALAGRTVCIVGLGAVGSPVARRLTR
jgi:lactate dehydrogenase-like 2-hydroxyacid dehydrogenase